LAGILNCVLNPARYNVAIIRSVGKDETLFCVTSLPKGSYATTIIEAREVAIK